ncbi:FGGY-family carbohydrate kinase [Shewanella sp. Isolate8]|uniref:FGGY-family carbohydrate kinase n=1 Tax=Shewanella sp. Isolate8 TaxID=2908529 RepID=UPI001EFDEDFC|nr:FGGY-family carbohydrate kinase [Shewanella sp. Isolate8]MCG9746128.1 FGGY-family carbohydrate kinase [Shewanella sp. Isolate8]
MTLTSAESSARASTAGDNPYFLALDYGTQSVRALVFDRQGQLIAKRQHAVQPYRDGAPGVSEQSADYCYRQLVDVVRGLFEHTQVLPGQIKGMALTTQRACTVLLDDAGEAISPVYMWSDRRLASNELPPMAWYYRLGFLCIGLRRRIQYLRRAAKVNYLFEHHKDKLVAADKVALLSGYLTGKITGRLIDSEASQVAYLPFDYRRKTWANRRSWRWQALACSPSQMVPLAAPTQAMGKVSEHFAKDTGLATGLAVYGAGADKACEVYAAGCGEQDIACISLGSAAILAWGGHRYREAYRYLPAFPSIEATDYITEIQLERGFWLLSWLIEQFGAQEVKDSTALGISPEQYITQAIAKVPIGADGLMLSPLWAQGVIYPGPEARGSIIGFTPEHGRLHLYRAAIEGILMTLKQGLLRLEPLKGSPFRLVRVTGGGAQSDLVMQMCADIFNRPVERLSLHEASGLGAAMCCAVGAGIYPDLARARRQMRRLGEKFEPQAEHVAQYASVFKAYEALYPQIKPFFKKVNKQY